MTPTIEIKNGVLYLKPHEYVHNSYEWDLIPVKLITFVSGIKTRRVENSQLLHQKHFIIGIPGGKEIRFECNQYQAHDEYNKRNQDDIKQLIDVYNQIRKAVENTIGGLNINYPKNYPNL